LKEENAKKNEEEPRIPMKMIELWNKGELRHRKDLSKEINGGVAFSEKMRRRIFLDKSQLWKKHQNFV
jgi:hypothetical protein